MLWFEFAVAVRALDENMEILKYELVFAFAEHKSNKSIMTQEIIRIKGELDKAVQLRMKLREICYRPNNNNNNRVAVSAAA